MPRITVNGLLVSNIFKKQEEKTSSGKDKYVTQIVLNDGEIEKLRNARDEALKEIFEGKLPHASKFDDYIEVLGSDPEKEVTLDKYFIRPVSTVRPISCYLRNHQGEIESVSQDDAVLYFYRGAYVAASIDVYASMPKKGKATRPFVSSTGRALLFMKHGEPLTSEAPFQENEFAGLQSEFSEDDFDA